MAQQEENVQQVIIVMDLDKNYHAN